MAGGSDAVLRVRVYDPRSDERDDDAAQAATLEKFDLMLCGDSLQPLVALMSEMLRRY
jgi:hypothetical protein